VGAGMNTVNRARHRSGSINRSNYCSALVGADQHDNPIQTTPDRPDHTRFSIEGLYLIRPLIWESQVRSGVVCGLGRDVTKRHPSSLQVPA